MRFLGFSNQEKGAPRQETLRWSTVCSTFSRSGWSGVRSSSLAEGGTSKKRPSPHLHKVPTRIHKGSPRTLQMAFVDILRTPKDKTRVHEYWLLIEVHSPSTFGGGTNYNWPTN
jgi:hypothetical protein